MLRKQYGRFVVSNTDDSTKWFGVVCDTWRLQIGETEPSLNSDVIGENNEWNPMRWPFKFITSLLDTVIHDWDESFMYIHVPFHGVIFLPLRYCDSWVQLANLPCKSGLLEPMYQICSVWERWFKPMSHHAHVLKLDISWRMWAHEYPISDMIKAIGIQYVVV